MSACGSSGGGTGEPAPSAGTSSAADRIESCIDRLVRNATARGASEDDARRYARDTYCSRFGRNGWVYDDGALSIDAHVWLEEGGSCATASEGEPSRTVPCEDEVRGGIRRLECALLHHVRKSDVRTHLEQLRLEGPVECDDGTPLEELGVPQEKDG